MVGVGTRIGTRAAWCGRAVVVPRAFSHGRNRVRVFLVGDGAWWEEMREVEGFMPHRFQNFFNHISDPIIEVCH